MRNRIVKEGFFLNYELCQLEPLARILFVGLWCLADRDGRLWDRPQQIKAACLPYDDCDIENLLTKLHELKFITRYETSERKCIQVVNFTKHQTLTTWEKATSSDIPLQKNFRRTSEVRRKAISGTSEELQREQTDQSREDQIGSEQKPPFGGELFVSVLAEFEQHRKDIHKALKPTGRKALYAKLESFGEQGAIRALRTSVENGWTGIFEPRGNGRKAEGLDAVHEVLAEIREGRA